MQKSNKKNQGNNEQEELNGALQRLARCARRVQG
jgi:hypothetical protein